MEAGNAESVVQSAAEASVVLGGRESFQDESRRLLDKYEIDFDERYVWG